MAKNSNIVPRDFKKIIGKMKVNTNMNKVGDEIHISKVNGEYIAMNINNGKTFCMLIGYIRNTDIFEMISVEK